MLGYNHLSEYLGLDVPPFYYGANFPKGRLEGVNPFTAPPGCSPNNFDCESDYDVDSDDVARSNSAIADLVSKFNSTGFSKEGRPVIRTFLSERETLALVRYNGPFLELEFGDIHGLVQASLQAYLS